MTKNLDNDMKRVVGRWVEARWLFVGVFALVLFGATPDRVNAAGLGRLAVFSALGQPLRAEVDIIASREELVGMSAQLAPREAFKQMGLDYARLFSNLEFKIEKRPNGQAVIKLSTREPVDDPFVDLLLEISWPSGRIVREYTFLLDPQELPLHKSDEDANAPMVGKLPEARGGAEASRGSPRISNATRARALGLSEESGEAAADENAAVSAAPSPKAGVGVYEAGAYEVKRGDTLYRIAAAVKPEGVSLDRMLVGLFCANQSAFDGKNIHRLKKGRILVIPDPGVLDQIPKQEMRRVIAQAQDWASYRSKVASMAAQMPEQEGQARQGAAGKITAKVEDRAAPVVGRQDQVKISQTRSGGRAGVSGLVQEERVAHEKAMAEATSRVAALEKSVNDLQELLKMKDRSLAELQQRLEAQRAQLAQAQTQAQPPAQSPRPATAQTPSPSPTAQTAQTAQASRPAAPPQQTAQARQKPKVPVPPPPPEEPGIIDLVVDNWMLIAGGLAVLALLGGGVYFFIRWRRGRLGDEIPLDELMTMTDEDDGDSASVFQNVGGRNVDTSSRSDMTKSSRSDFSQAGPGSIDTEEIDVIAEADMYISLNRDTEAENVLLEAKQRDSKRYDIHLKLLEIYERRKDLRQFEALAIELFSETGGMGDEWEEAAALGIKLDPTNILYGGSAASEPMVSVPQLPPQESTVVMPSEFSQMAKTAMSNPPPPPPPPSPLMVDSVLDFNLGSANPGGSAPAPSPTFVQTAPPAPQPMPFASSPGVSSASLEATNIAPIGAATRANPASLEATNIAPIAQRPQAADDHPSGEISLMASNVNPPQPPAPSPAKSFSMSDINLDLKAPELLINSDVTGLQKPSDDDTFIASVDAEPVNDEVTTKLQLAVAYKDMGDLDGARELLQEVIREGNEKQRTDAQAHLGQLDS